MEEEIKIISQTILEFQDSGRTSNDALARIIIGNLEKNGYKLKKLSQHDVIKNGVAVCPLCGSDKLGKYAGQFLACFNVGCDWQTVL
jgi:hypothetical protein